MTRPTVPEVLPIMRAYAAKPGNGAGGALHCVLDDGNVRNQDVEWCRAHAEESGDTDGVALADLLLKMTRTQRAKLAGMFYAD